MGTKLNPGLSDCYAKALPDEPIFVLLGRDPTAPGRVRDWAARRLVAIFKGDRPDTDIEMVVEALVCADTMVKWRLKNDGRWRQPQGAE